MATRTPPAAFVAELQRRFGSEYDVQWNDGTARWEILGPTPDGRRVAQTWGWYTRRDPHTGATVRVPPDELGRPPFRDLDPEAQAEILRNMERSFVGHSTNGGTVARRFDRHVRSTRETLRRRRRQRAEAYVNLLWDAGTVRPSTLWKKIHVRGAATRRPC
jgi:hypothetical protein